MAAGALEGARRHALDHPLGRIGTGREPAAEAPKTAYKLAQMR